MVIVIRIAIVLVAGYAAWRLLRPDWAFTIVADQSGVRSHKGITTPQQRRLLELFRTMRFVEGRVRICGRNDKNGKLELRFFGRMSPEARLQIRNYVVNEL